MNRITEFLRGLIADKLGIEKTAVDSNTAFFALGVTSLISEEILTILQEKYQNLSSTLLFEYPNINKLSQFLADQEGKGKNGQAVKKIQAESSVDSEGVLACDEYSLEAGNSIAVNCDDIRNRESTKGYDIAVIGLSGKFPQADDQFEYWKNLIENRDCVEEIPADRWDYLPLYVKEKSRENKTYGKWGGFINDVDKFDPFFFSIPPREAELMDPQQKLFLMCCWEAMEDAGYGNRANCRTKKIGVFVGTTWHEFSLCSHEEGWLEGQYKGPGALQWGIANRVSYCLDLTGPSMTIDTACSSSLVAIHQACQAILAGDCDMALAGGVNLSLHPSKYVFLSQANFLSSDGKCRSFGEGGNGYVPGEGLGAVLLKPLTQAKAEGDYIYGVIKGSATNHGGKATGYTVPNPEAHREVIVTALERAAVHPEDLTYIECHGTGTELGDPIEIKGLSKAFEMYSQKKQFCRIGSVKSNIGHLEAAAGIAGLIKVLLGMKYKSLPASLHSEVINSKIDFQNSPFILVRQNEKWEAPEGKSLIAGISSFGAGGSNAHLIVESFTNLCSFSPDSYTCGEEMIPLSTQTQGQLVSYARKLADFISAINPTTGRPYTLHNIAKTLQIGRKAYAYRLAILASSLQELQDNLHSYIAGKPVADKVFSGKVKSAVSAQRDNTLPAQELKVRALCWVEGESSHAEMASSKFLKVPLPTYPFLKEKCWIHKQFGVNRNGTELHGAEEDFAVRSVTTEVTGEESGTAAAKYIREMIAAVSKIPLHKLEPETSFEELGLDSLMIEELNKKVEQWVGTVEAAVFYKYKNIRDLAGYFVEAYPQAVSALRTSKAPSGDKLPVLPLTRPKPSLTSLHMGTESRNSLDLNHSATTDIAIIGIAGRYPQAATLAQFWRNLYDGKDCIEEIPPDRWPLEGFYEADREKAVAQGLSYSKWGGFLEQVKCFDPLFFNISPREAMLMDPQERLFLEVAWECLEDAGYTPRSLQQGGYGNQIGVFVGATFNNYQLFTADAAQRSHQAMYAVNSQIFSLANRVSFIMDFTGPSLTVDTACSSSLYALHLACESIRSGQACMAIAGGVNLSLHPSKYISLCQGQFNASDGRCRAFCEGGTGYVPGEAVGAVFLKPLPQAIHDNDLIYGVIKGTAVSHGGRTNGYTVPSPVAQSLAIEKALERSRISPRSISCIEAHGTGTALGDPIEITGLLDVFQKYTKDTGFCSISSVKSNIGHGEAAAGIAQLTKVLLQLKHQTLVKNVMHGKGINPNISFDQTPFVLQQDTAYWQRPIIDGEEVPRRAGISSFGAGGANAHIVVEEYISQEPVKFTAASFHTETAIVLSAKSEECLYQQAKQLLAAIGQEQWADIDLPGIAYTLQVGREAFDERLALVVTSIQDMAEKLQGFIEGEKASQEVYRGQAKGNRENLMLFADDEDMAQTLAAWLKNGKYNRILSLWVTGISFDWNKLYGDSKPRRVSLPTYPFAREPYWIEVENGKVSNVTEVISSSQPLLQQNSSKPSPQCSLSSVAVSFPPDGTPSDELQENFEIMTFTESWQEQAVQRSAASKIKTIVCFSSDQHIRQLIQTRMENLAAPINLIFVAQGAVYKQHSRQSYSVVREDIQTFREAFQNIRGEYGEIDGVFYLWALEDTTCIRDYTGIVYILQAMAIAKLKVGRLLLAGQFADRVEKSYLESWIGFERSLGLVLPHTKVAVVYQKALENQDKAIYDWVEKLCAELQSESFQSVIYQGGKRYVYQVQPTTIQPGESLLIPGGTYLITGGCGGLGLVFANYIAQKHPVNLVLTGRSPLNTSKRASLESLEKLGSKVAYIQADISDLSGMKEGLNKAKARFGTIRGVIHAAGNARQESIFGKDMQAFQQVLTPKTEGTIVLDELLREESLDFMCYFSSSSAILGDFGGCDYAIANRFLMAYAQYRNEELAKGLRRGKTVVISWPLWKDGGMSVGNEENTDLYLKSSGQRFLQSAEGLELFERLLWQGNTHHLVLVGQPSRVRRFLGFDQAQPETSSAAAFVRQGRRAEMTGLNGEQCLEWDMKEIISSLLKIPRDKLNRKNNLADFGFDSVSLAQFANLLSKHYGVEISPALFFGYSTIAKLVNYFITEYPVDIDAFYKEAAAAEAPLREAVAPQGEEDKRVQPISAIKGAMGGEEPVAIIGISGRFPQARDIQELWSILVDGQDAVTELPAERRFYPEAEKIKWRGGWLAGVGEFDAPFFDISPREAQSMDPRQRLLLQESWKALEDAGYGASQLATNKIGMFVGAEEGDYQWLVGDKGSITSNHNGVLAARLAYFLNLNGPVMTLNTACSSGLVAVHQACMSLRAKECDTALAAGVSLILTPRPYEEMSKAGMLSEDGKSYAFDKRANGMVPGEAVAAIVLKRLSQAEADGDPIYAIIRGSGINHDGKTNGITAPNGVAQANLLKSVYHQYKVNPEEIKYIVTHGTGTKLGDPVEINALYDAFTQYTKKQGYCALTSTKPNFGHTLAASGMVSLISLVQALRYEQIPASLYCEQENAYINWQESPFYVNKTNKSWGKVNGKKRLGAVSAFGMSGTNAHVVVESYEGLSQASLQAPCYLIALSAKTPEALQDKTKDMIAVLQNRSKKEPNLREISYTLLEGRQHFKYRCALVVQGQENAIYLLQQASIKEKLPNLFYGEVPRDFTGQKVIEEYAQELLNEVGSLHDGQSDRCQEILYALADLYCQGYQLPWNKLYGEERPRRIHLPTYPFVKEHYWVTGSVRKSAASTVRVSNTLDLPEERTTVRQSSLKPATAMTAVLSNTPDKRDGIVLQSLSDKQFEANALAAGTKLINAGKSMLRCEPRLEKPVLSGSIEKDLQAELAASLAEVLYMSPEEVDVDKKFIDMGLDSIIGVEWIKLINKQYNTSIQATKVYDYPTIAEFAAFLSQKVNGTDRVLKTKTALSSPELSVTDIPPQSDQCSLNASLEKELATGLAEVLYMEPGEIDMDKKFIDMGLDSIIGVEWIKVINKQYGVAIGATKVYDYPTIHEFASFLKEELKKGGQALVQSVSPSARQSAPSFSLTELEISKSTPVTSNGLDNGKQQEHPQLDIKPENLGNPVFQSRYGCKWSYFAGSMYRGISSEELVVAMGRSQILSFFGSSGLSLEELEPHIQSIQAQLGCGRPYGMCLIANLDNPEEERQQVELFLKYDIPVIEAAAYTSMTLPLVYFRIKGIYRKGDSIIRPRRIIAKCSRLEIARLFLSTPPVDIVNQLLLLGWITEDEAELSQYIPMADDLAVEANSGGHTDQGVSFTLVPAVISLREKMKQEYSYQEEILIGCGGGIGTPQAVASAFMLGVDFIFTGSINQCTVESGAHPVVKDLLNTLSIHDTAMTIAGDMFEIGAKVQVVRKNTQFHIRANRLYQVFTTYNCLEEIPPAITKEIEERYFKKSFQEVWQLVCEYKNKRKSEQIAEAKKNPRLKMALLFKWYFSHCNQITLNGEKEEKDNFQIFCGPSLGAFNDWVQGTPYAHWKNRHVDEIAELLMSGACEHLQSKKLAAGTFVKQGTMDNRNISSVSAKHEDDCPIAIIGMAGQFPKANTLAEFWNNLAQGKDCISEIPAARWSVEEYYHPDAQVSGKSCSKWMGVLEDADKFDPLFFNISPAEAELMDPQQRIFLENCWKCMEDAGLSPAVLSGSRCGVFVGCGTTDYGETLHEKKLNAQGLMGRATSILSARISYLLNLKGPCLAIETACSSSLVAIAEACDSLKLGTSDMAFAGGVCVLPGPSMHIMTSKSGMLSPDGRCFTFDNRANGFVPGEGVGVVLLKRLTDAVRDQDRICGVIRGWGINQDGKTNGITAPSTQSQTQLEKAVYEQFKIHPENISLVEAHGTGTKLGDPIEVEALTEAFRTFTHRRNYCAIGSVKSNIGHLLAAAGVSGVIKVLLSLQHKMLPPTIHYKNLNEHISLEDTPFYVNTVLRPWTTNFGIPRCACVSSFGFSGTNAHLVIEEYQPQTAENKIVSRAVTADDPVLFVLSAKSEEKLKIYANVMKEWLAAKKDVNLVDMAYTLQVGREAMNCRLALVTDSRESLQNALEKFCRNQSVTGLLTAKVKKDKNNLATIETEEAKQVLLQTWLQKKEWNHVAELWMKGLNVNWNQLYSDGKPCRISLPTYPFARDSYWISESKGGEEDISLQGKENFNRQQCEKWIDEMMNDAVSVDDVVRNIVNS